MLIKILILMVVVLILLGIIFFDRIELIYLRSDIEQVVRQLNTDDTQEIESGLYRASSLTAYKKLTIPLLGPSILKHVDHSDPKIQVLAVDTLKNMVESYDPAIAVLEGKKNTEKNEVLKIAILVTLAKYKPQDKDLFYQLIDLCNQKGELAYKIILARVTSAMSVGAAGWKIGALMEGDSEKMCLKISCSTILLPLCASKPVLRFPFSLS